ncbi:MAG: adenylosuccinate lyase [Pseudomonadota bacterium]
MIPRYARQKMIDLWSDRRRFEIWLEIETYVCEVQEDSGLVPAGTTKALKAATIKDRSVAEIQAIEEEVRHDIIAFLTYIEKQVGPPARFMHQGLTSSDILDTTLAVQLNAASAMLLEDLDDLLAVLKARAWEHKDTLCIGRTHGIHAEPTTFGLKLAGYHAEFARNRARLEDARCGIATCALSGAVGTFAHNPPEIEERVAHKLGLAAETISTQIIPRDRHAHFFAVLAVIASSIERLAIEIRHLQRTEVREAQEYFKPGQKGSSAMPHKKNPILSENLTGLARIVRSAVIPALENVAQWHERDIAHSSVERMIAPDATTTLDFALVRLTSVIKNLIVHADRMRANLENPRGLIYSQRVLLALCDKGLARQEAYTIVQRHALKAWQDDSDFMRNLQDDPQVNTRLSKQELVALFDARVYTKHADAIFARVFGASDDVSQDE